jgi:2-amino-4-hydroxy-6-hydroxymethyldihydropteridine diphosphokinase
MELRTAVYFSIGSNLGDRISNLRNAVHELSEHVGQVTNVSPVYESEPVGFESNDQFLNACVKVETELSPQEVLATIHRIENKMGRIRNPDGSYASRTLDIDIILYGQKVLSSHELRIPHPLYKDRLFVLLPLTDIDPHLIDPLSGIAISTLLKSCGDTSGISRTDEVLFI